MEIVRVSLLLSLSLAVYALPGGWSALDVHDKETKAIATAAVEEIDKASNAMYKNKLVKITEAESQVVAGIKYRLTLEVGQSDCRKGDTKDISQCNVNHPTDICIVEFWVQPWVKSQQVTSMHCTPSQKPLLGGNKDSSPQDEDVLHAADYAVEEMNTRSNSMYRGMLLDVKKVTKQTVAGTKFSMVLSVALSKCKNTPARKHSTLQDCPIDRSQPTEDCTVDVVEQPWMTPRYTMPRFKCLPGAKVMDKKAFAQQADAVMTQGQPSLGGDDHDVGRYDMFVEFKQKYGRQYVNKKEEMERYEIFHANMVKAKKLQEHEKGSATYGASKFADMSEEEFRKNYLSPEWDTTPDPEMEQAQIPVDTLPTTWDWRDHNAVTEVKNQGSCGSCWAFSTTGNVEGQWALKKGKLLSLSEQELVDCDKIDQGCNGGLPSNAYKVIKNLGGLETEKEYPYEGRGEKCHFDKKEVDAYINGSVVVSSDEGDMAQWLYKNGPISIGINANAMQFYMGGVSHPWALFCNPETLDHGVLIAGFGVKKGWFSDNPYWLIKNSWGPDWGEKGYYLVYRGAGVCGLNKMPTSATIK